LFWKQDRLIREDFENSVRLAHTVTKQVFQGSEPTLKLLDLCDLYIRDSSLGTYKPRLSFLALLLQHLKTKKQLITRMSESMRARLDQSINALNFVHSYYSQFFPKLQ
jgi:hypothetical protein